MTPAQAAALPPAIHLSPGAEASLVFWTSAADSIHPARVVAEALGVAENTLCNWRAAGEGPAYLKGGGRVYYRKSAVVAWMERA